jgi:hypothetical protein
MGAIIASVLLEYVIRVDKQLQLSWELIEEKVREGKIGPPTPAWVYVLLIVIVVLFFLFVFLASMSSR